MFNKELKKQISELEKNVVRLNQAKTDLYDKFSSLQLYLHDFQERLSKLENPAKYKKGDTIIFNHDYDNIKGCGKQKYHVQERLKSIGKIISVTYYGDEWIYELECSPTKGILCVNEDAIVGLK